MGSVKELKKILAQRETRISELEKLVREKDEEITELRRQVDKRDSIMNQLHESPISNTKSKSKRRDAVTAEPARKINLHQVFKKYSKTKQ